MHLTMLIAHPYPHEGVSSYLQDGIYCSDQNCKLCNGPGKKVTFIHDFLEFLSDHVPEPAGGAEHWQWAQLCVQLAGHFSFHPLFRKILSERVLDLLAGAFPAKETMIDGMNLTHHDFVGGFSLAIANSRELRDTRQLECPEMMGRTMWRGISSKSHLATTPCWHVRSTFQIAGGRFTMQLSKSDCVTSSCWLPSLQVKCNKKGKTKQAPKNEGKIWSTGFGNNCQS